jgi:hypothetical protein
VSAERQAQAWLRDLDVEHAVRTEIAMLNRVLHMHRLSATDPYVHEVSPEQALAIRAGWGEGEHVADGRWVYARELRVADSGGTRARRRRRGGRVAALRSQERFAELLGARSKALVCEEFALRARLDLDQGRVEHATAELANAYRAALSELREEALPELELRVAELEALAPAIAPDLARARAAPAPGHYEAPQEEEPRQRARAAPPPGHYEPPRDEQPRQTAQPDEETLRHALERLEAALRARVMARARA